VKVSEFDYDLPESLIAQEPLERRDASRLLLLGRRSGRVRHARFSDLPGRLRSGDLAVFNDTRVFPARLRGGKATGGRVEILLLERAGGTDAAPEWTCLLRASRAPRPGENVLLADGFSAVVLERGESDWTVRLEETAGRPLERLETLGEPPLPPYIRREPGDARLARDRERYQTVYARESGAVAAPTAGLHFTRDLMDALDRRGVERAWLTLHVGGGTFLPVRTERVEEHRMHAERFRIPEATADAVRRARSRGGHVVAVGTTVVRALEASAREHGDVRAGSGRCDLFIYPRFSFRAVDALVTNFHLPRSTLLMLVSAFAGRGHVLEAYREAVATGYRFYSYGDAMLVEPD